MPEAVLHLPERFALVNLKALPEGEALPDGRLLASWGGYGIWRI